MRLKPRMIRPVGTLLFSLLLLGCSSTSADVPLPAIDSFEDCVNAGYPVLRSFPGQCTTPDGRTFIQQVAPSALEHLSQTAEILDFDQCLNSGYPVIEGLPRRCVFGEQTFIEPNPLKRAADPAPRPTTRAAALCVDLCGNGSCEEMVCMGTGCPCAETSENCKADCG